MALVDRKGFTVSMQMRVHHTTTYSYSEEAHASYSEARLTPLTTADQYVRRSRLEISPTPWSSEYRDYWGTTVSAFEVTDPHHELRVAATSTVDTADAPEPVEGTQWHVLADPNVADQYCEFIAQSPITEPAEDVKAELDQLRQAAARPADYASAACELIRQRVRRLVAATHVTATAEQTWQAGKGVCHDISHVTIGALRYAGIPARFVAGYLHPQVEPVIGEKLVSEPHAWLEWWDGAWVGWDVAYAIVPGERHVIVSMGRDFSDSPPLRGIYAVEGDVHTEVTVEITRLA